MVRNDAMKNLANVLQQPPALPKDHNGKYMDQKPNPNIPGKFLSLASYLQSDELSRHF
jgi:hypothetical protein